MSWWSTAWDGISGFFKDNVGSIINGATSLIGTIQNNKNIDESLEAQKEQQLQDQAFDKQMWEAENDYNSYASQKARLEAAGLNSDLLYGNGGYMQTSASAPRATSIDWSSLANKRSPFSAVDDALDRKYKQAMIDNVNANTKKQGAETSILTDEAAFTKALKEGELKMQDAQIKLLGGQYNLTSQQITESQSRCQNLEASTNQLNALADSLRNSIKNDNARLDLERKINDATIKKLAAETNLNYEEAKRLSESLNAWLDNLNADTSVKLGQNASLEISNGRAEFDAAIHGPFNWNKDLNFFDNMLHFAVRYLETASTILGPAMNAAL